MKKIISLILSFALVFSLISVTTFATNANTTEVQFVTSTGEERTLVFKYKSDGSFTTTELSSNGSTISQATFDSQTRIVTQTIANKQSDNTEYSVDNFFILNTDDTAQYNHSTFSANSARSTISDPPLYDDGLPNSSTFIGYKYLGSLTYSGVVCDINRKINSTKEDSAYRFQVSPGTQISTLASILLGALGGPVGLTAAVATSLATAFIGAGVDSYLNGEITYTTIHYTYKLNCNNSKNYSYKFCSYQEWWHVYRQGDLVGYDPKNTQLAGHNFISLYESAQFAVRDYLDGNVTNVCCDMASA